MFSIVAFIIDSWKQSLIFRLTRYKIEEEVKKLKSILVKDAAG